MNRSDDSQIIRLLDRIDDSWAAMNDLRAEVERQRNRGKEILRQANCFRVNYRAACEMRILAETEVSRLRAELAEALGTAP